MRNKPSPASVNVGVNVGVLVYLAIMLLGVIGYVLNIVKIIGTANTELANMTVMFVLRVVGVFAAPLGAILGYF